MLACRVDVCQAQGHERARGVLGQPALAHLGKTPQPLDHREDMLHAGPHLGLVAIPGALQFIDFASLAYTLVGEVTRVRSL